MTVATVAFLAVSNALPVPVAQAQTPMRMGEPVWTPLGYTDASASQTCFFRKKFTLIDPAEGQIRMEASGRFELFINGKSVHSGNAGDPIVEVEAIDFLRPGLNLIAVEVEASGAQRWTNGYFRMREQGEARWRSIPTDTTWVTSEDAHPLWQTAAFPDRGWIPAQVVAFAPAAAVSELGVPAVASPAGAPPARQASGPVPSSTVFGPHQANPADGIQVIGPTPDGARDLIQPTPGQIAMLQPQAAPAPASSGLPGPDEPPVSAPEFSPPDGFTVEALVGPDECGSLIAMEFDEAGLLIVSREGGGLEVIDLARPAGEQRVEAACDEVKNCQGILALNGNLYVTADGPDGLGIYELVRQSAENMAFNVSKTLVNFTGEPGEHGPHGLTLGPDGRIYCVIGNGSQIAAEAGPGSPFRQPIDIDLAPRVEDPGGHGAGIRAPGGTVIRVAIDGSGLELVAGGIRNAYDLVFNPQGDLFAHDSDMESDAGMAWNRPTQLFHVALGADLGWRSGWCNLPGWCPDITPAIADTGRGSPTGAVCYRHLVYPAKYHHALFLADWSEGRILTARLTSEGGGYKVATETFLSGRPMNVTDLTVGEDGSLYFCTGGRGTAGGVYRVKWNGSVPDELFQFENKLAQALRHPQPDAAWARQNIAVLSGEMGADWNRSLAGAAIEPRNNESIRLQAIDVMMLYGAPPDEATIRTLLQDASPAIRARVARACGTSGLHPALVRQLLNDGNLQVRRAACEALLDTSVTLTAEELSRLLADQDRTIALAGMRLLQRQPVAEWFGGLVEAGTGRASHLAALAALSGTPDLTRSYAVLAVCSRQLKGFLSDRDLTSLLRTVQVALAQGQVDPAKIPAFTEQLKREFPTANPQLNAELAKILVALKAGSFGTAWNDYLSSPVEPLPLRLQTAMYLAAAAETLNDADRIAVIAALHSIPAGQHSGNQKLYLQQAAQRTARQLSEAGCQQVLVEGTRWPAALVAVLYRLEGKVTPTIAGQLVELDRQLAEQHDSATTQARIGIIALLAQAGDEAGLEHLRQLWRTEEQRRNDIAIGLAQHPDGKNWSYLVASLPILDDMVAREVIQSLAKVQQRPVDARHFRDLIELGWRLGAEGGATAALLVELWAGNELVSDGDDWQAALQNCTRWFEQQWPAETPVAKRSTVDPAEGASTHQVDQLLGYLVSNQERGNPERGWHLFTSTRCAECHRFGTEGDSAGPDLTSLATRYSRRETLEAILHPHDVIPAQYRSTTVEIADGRVLTGLKTDNGDGTITVLENSGHKTRIALGEIAAQKPADSSSMPAGLVDRLSRDEINDLFAYLYGQTRVSAGATPAVR